MENKEIEIVEEQGKTPATKKTTTKKRTATKAKEAEPTKIIPKDVNPEQYVTVKNGFQGRLIYISSRTGETFIWEEFGDEQDIELRELKNAKNSAKAFFENNWFMFDEDWIVDYLGVGRFYEHAVSIEDFDDIFMGSPEEVKNVISELTDGQKRSAAYRARVLIAEEKIDSHKTIKALEEALGVELIER